MEKENTYYFDPVCGMKVTKPEEKDLRLFSTAYNGKIFYFCSPFCTAAFLDNPKRYINNKDNYDGNDSKRNSL
ncbi:MAG: hypothetical protein CMF23_15525 [Ignavibacteriae bacterium]|jgi:YHS domain-containing protein|nr:hypothetical protein [Ignavibacteriota bacterium]MCO6474587.1 YHS domain-containing protein [Melioribacteraceae bacterium]MDD3557156.1 YHS domain-containing protein [Melioribacteraceae bacterium]GJQ61123.1 MAG: hypothetical protein SCALA702_01760 [Melioribacteraceae bacterium]